jgi:hypothetical protein
MVAWGFLHAFCPYHGVGDILKGGLWMAGMPGAISPLRTVTGHLPVPAGRIVVRLGLMLYLMQLGCSMCNPGHIHDSFASDILMLSVADRFVMTLVHVVGWSGAIL